ncbi:RNase P modulator RnpM [Rummeliibacillus suwonensis]|uniref:RNase P modulator RnpM n=1 Tax=Rummeliibacillus suwonensis TaxID=1306154 RepID=UPI0028A22591|nr:YlxR family protein [Rummeliibacillus suwonensis]
MPINRKVPIRKCIATGEMLPKKEMIRVVRTKEGEVEVDLTGKKSGRGAYVSKSEAAIQTAKERNVFERQLEVNVPDQIYDDLLAIVRKELKA